MQRLLGVQKLDFLLLCPRQAEVEGAAGIGFSQALLVLRIFGGLLS